MAQSLDVQKSHEALASSQAAFHAALDNWQSPRKLRALAREMFRAAFLLGAAERAQAHAEESAEVVAR